jgi:hypothetical protein
MIWHMADSVALRSRRYRAHRAGSHHLCRHHAPLPVPYTAPLPDDEFDAAAELALLAGRLRDAYAAEPGNAALARELRVTLQAMASPPDPFDELPWHPWRSTPE